MVRETNRERVETFLCARRYLYKSDDEILQVWCNQLLSALVDEKSGAARPSKHPESKRLLEFMNLWCAFANTRAALARVGDAAVDAAAEQLSSHLKRTDTKAKLQQLSRARPQPSLNPKQTRAVKKTAPLAKCSLESLAQELLLRHAKQLIDLTASRLVSGEVTDIIEGFDRDSRWVATEVLLCAEAERPQVVSQFVRLAQRSLDLGNFAGVFVITMGLNHQAVRRIKTLWEKVPNKVVDMLGNLERLSAPSGNFRELRAAVTAARASGAPSVPYAGIFLRDIAVLKETSSKFQEDGAVNFATVQMVGRLVKDLIEAQACACRYNISMPATGVSRRIVSDDQTLYNVSMASQDMAPELKLELQSGAVGAGPSGDLRSQSGASLARESTDDDDDSDSVSTAGGGDGSGTPQSSGAQLDFFPWSEAYQTGIVAVDERHEQWVRALNELIEAVNAAGLAGEKKGKMPAEGQAKLALALRESFELEEGLFLKVGDVYKKASKHVEEHRKMSELVERGTVSSLVKLCAMMPSHMLDVDPTFAPYVIAAQQEQIAGVILACAADYVRTARGSSTMTAALEKCGLPVDLVFDHGERLPYSLLLRLVQAVADQASVPLPELIEAIGAHWIPFVSQPSSGYSPLLDVLGPTFSEALNHVNRMHVLVRSSYFSDSTPPEITPLITESGRLVVAYKPGAVGREAMVHFFVGLVRSLGRTTYALADLDAALLPPDASEARDALRRGFPHKRQRTGARVVVLRYTPTAAEDAAVERLRAEVAGGDGSLSARRGPPMTETVEPNMLADLHPFHFCLRKGGETVQIGPSLRKLLRGDDKLDAGAANVTYPLAASGPIDLRKLKAHLQEVAIVAVNCETLDGQRKVLNLRGMFMYRRAGKLLFFFGTPLLRTDEMAAFGLSYSDFAASNELSALQMTAKPPVSLASGSSSGSALRSRSRGSTSSSVGGAGDSSARRLTSDSAPGSPVLGTPGGGSGASCPFTGRSSGGESVAESAANAVAPLFEAGGLSAAERKSSLDRIKEVLLVDARRHNFAMARVLCESEPRVFCALADEGLLGKFLDSLKEDSTLSAALLARVMLAAPPLKWLAPVLKRYYGGAEEGDKDKDKSSSSLSVSLFKTLVKLGKEENYWPLWVMRFAVVHLGEGGDAALTALMAEVARALKAAGGSGVRYGVFGVTDAQLDALAEKPKRIFGSHQADVMAFLVEGEFVLPSMTPDLKDQIWRSVKESFIQNFGMMMNHANCQSLLKEVLAFIF